MNGTPVIALFGSGYAGLGSGGSCHPYNRAYAPNTRNSKSASGLQKTSGGLILITL
jgi:hypothetical protein